MIEREDRGAIAVLRMARGKGNSLDIAFLDALVAELDAIERSPAQALVITGQGRAFSAGVDLPAVVAGGREYLERFLPALSRALERIALFPRPVVAAVNGHAIAGGYIIMMATDYRLLALSDARLGLTELLVGVPFPAWALEIARARTPRELLPELCYTGRTLLPTEAHARGLVEELVEQDRLLDRACEIAAQLALVPAEAFSLTKRHLSRPMVDAVRGRAEADDREVQAIWTSPAALANIRAFVERTLRKG